MGPGPGLAVAHVLWRYCMRLASSGVGGVRRVRLAFCMLVAVSVSCGCSGCSCWHHQVCVGGWIGCHPKASRTRRTPPTPDDAGRMQYSYTKPATSPGPGPIALCGGLTCCVRVGGPTTSDACAGGDGSLSVHARLGRHAFGACVRWPTSGAPLGSQSLSGVAAKRPAGWSPEAGRGAVSGRADGAGTGAGAAARRTRKDRRNAPGVGVGGDTAPLVRLLLHVVEPAPRLSPLDLLLELRTLQLAP